MYWIPGYGSFDLARSMLRVRTLTLYPSEIRRETSRLPTNPVAPVALTYTCHPAEFPYYSPVTATTSGSVLASQVMHSTEGILLCLGWSEGLREVP